MEGIELDERFKGVTVTGTMTLNEFWRQVCHLDGDNWIIAPTVQEVAVPVEVNNDEYEDFDSDIEGSIH